MAQSIEQLVGETIISAFPEYDLTDKDTLDKFINIVKYDISADEIIKEIGREYTLVKRTEIEEMIKIVEGVIKMADEAQDAIDEYLREAERG